MNNPWIKVVFADQPELRFIVCVGPTQDGFEYEERDGVMFARKTGKLDRPEAALRRIDDAGATANSMIARIFDYGFSLVGDFLEFPLHYRDDP